jgi:AcrR family transcriptional regulator
MEIEVLKNKQGQTLGRKGQESRAKLMQAARTLLMTESPLELTAVAIAAEAGTSPASFYMYFDDTKDLLYALSEVAGQDMAKIHAIFDLPWELENLEQRAADVIAALYAVWDEHRPVLRYRNLEATRGDERFSALRLNTFIPFIERFAERILSINPAQGTRRRSDAYSEATILHGAMEHLAATDPDVMAGGLGARRVNANLARITAMVMRGGAAPGSVAMAPEATALVAPAQAATNPTPRARRAVPATQTKLSADKGSPAPRAKAKPAVKPVKSKPGVAVKSPTARKAAAKQAA